MVTQANNNSAPIDPSSPVISAKPLQKTVKTPQDSFVWRAFLLSKGVSVKRV